MKRIRRRLSGGEFEEKVKGWVILGFVGYGLGVGILFGVMEVIGGF